MLQHFGLPQEWKRGCGCPLLGAISARPETAQELSKRPPGRPKRPPRGPPGRPEEAKIRRPLVGL
eukprot:4635234-Pyramimonas_sp.AAC.1